MSHIMQKANKLAKEASPYLRQHAFNPVDWYPWGEEALQKAKSENKPILLSIGYTACHWCHVMAHESFADQETAQLMNELFVNIKVDREERPDLDKIYQTAHYVLTRSNGGWPLTVFLTPQDLIPFFSGTYFPKQARYNLPAFKDILKMLSTIYKNNFNDIEQQNSEVFRILQDQSRNLSYAVDSITDYPLKKALSELQEQFDPTNGGFGPAPKFPHASKLEFLLLQNQADLVIKTLMQMGNGGIYDQLGSGFFRYSVDASWQIPHFEKMLYDNGQLTYLYTIAGKLYENADFNNIASGVCNWAIQHMQATQNGYYASLDADSEGHEGKFYIWDKVEIKSILSAQEFSVSALYFGLDKPPNFENQYHFTIAQPLNSVAEELNITQKEAQHFLQSAKDKLLFIRNKRVPPETDKKILTAWNGLMIKGLLATGYSIGQRDFIDAAQKAITFIQQNFWHNKRLLACYAEGKAYLNAYLDDYAFLIDALITSLQVSWRIEHLCFAIELTNTLLKHFYDSTHGGFFFTADDQEQIIYRPKTFADEAVPAGNGVAIRSLLVLGHLLGETSYLEAAEKSLKAAWPYLERIPSEHCAVLLGLKEYLSPSNIIVIRGNEKELSEWQAKCQSINNLVFAIPNNEFNLPGALALRKPSQKTIAYICKGMKCSAPIENIDEL